MHMFGSTMGFGGGGFDIFMMLAFWGLLAAIVFFIIKQVSHSGRNETRESPREIAQKRLAAGEISKAEYDEIIRAL